MSQEFSPQDWSTPPPRRTREDKRNIVPLSPDENRLLDIMSEMVTLKHSLASAPITRSEMGSGPRIEVDYRDKNGVDGYEKTLQRMLDLTREIREIGERKQKH